MPSASELAAIEEGEREDDPRDLALVPSTSVPYYYIAGPMTGIPQYNFPAFEEAAMRLRLAGINVVSPHELDDEIKRARCMASDTGGNYEDTDELDMWKFCLKRDIIIVTDDLCIGVIVLDGWERSRGARLETYIAAALEKPITRLVLIEDDELGGGFELSPVDRSRDLEDYGYALKQIAEAACPT